MKKKGLKNEIAELFKNSKIFKRDDKTCKCKDCKCKKDKKK